MNKYLEYYLLLFKVGLLTIGGGIAMLPIITEELTDKKIANKEEIFDAYSKAQAVPGVIAVNTCVFLGYKLDGVKGAIFMTLGVISPSILIIYFLSILLNYYNNLDMLNTLFVGMRISVVAILLVTVFNLLKRISDSLKAIIFAASSFILATFTSVPIFIIIIVGGILSFFVFRGED